MEMWFSEFHTPDVKHSIRVNRQLYSKQSDYQRIDIFETPEFGRVLTLDGNVMLTERDEFIYDEMITHVPMSVHKNAKDILVIGAGDGGVVRELTRYDRVESIDLVEMDPQVIEACRAYLPGNACRMDDRRVHIYYENALKFIRKCEDEYDLIIVDSSDPFGPSEGLFTREFYGSCFNALRADGIMVNQQGSPFYAEDATAMQRSHQRIDIFETPEFGRVLTLDGNVMLTERDEFIYDEMIVHVPMAVHREAKDILVIGAGDGGVVRELTRYDRVERIDLVEMDPQVVEACRAYLPGNACRMDDRRVHIYFENALKFIRQCEEEYDLIIVDSSDPFGPSEGLFTREFYGSCFNALKEDGIMVNQQGSPFYAEDANAMQRSHKRIASTFPISRVYQAHIPTFAAGYWLFGFASKKYHPIDDLDAAAWKALNMRTRYYTTKLHIGAFYLPAFLEEMLREVEEH